MKKILDKIGNRINLYFFNFIVAPFVFDKIYEKFSNLKIKSIKETADTLANTNMSIGRFGDGEFSWMAGKVNNKDDFEKPSELLSKRLKEVFYSNDDGYMVGIMDSFKTMDELRNFPTKFWTMYFVKRRKMLLKLLDFNKQYYNLNITRPYIDYNYRYVADQDYRILKKVWKNKRILIVEGSESTLGADDDLFINAKSIERIECPAKNAFEKYDDIYAYTKEFLDSHNDEYITLISLGPTATVLSYDLYKSGHRALDVGHIDVEYEWYKMGVKDKVNLPYKYVNELPDGHSAKALKDDKFIKQIIKKID